MGGRVEGDSAILIDAVRTLEEAGPKDLSFYASPRYCTALSSTRAGAVVVGPDAPDRPTSVAYVRVAQPYVAFARIAQSLHPPRAYAPGVAAGAWVDPEASVAASATVMAGATVSRGATIGAGAVLFPGVYVGVGAAIGDASRLHPNVTVGDGCVVGARCTLWASAVVGADGFGFAYDAEQRAHLKIPQVGIVRVEDDVEIGAGSCIDRATAGETRIGRGTKIDNLVQVGHNCVIGPHSLLCAQVGLSGSTRLGAGVAMGGQSGSAGHLFVGDGARVAAQSGVMSDLEAGAEVGGSPALPLRSWLRSAAVVAKLPELLRRLRELERRLERVEEGAKG